MNTNEMFKLLYSSNLADFYDVYDLLYKFSEDISKNPEIKYLIQGVAKEKGLFYEYDGSFYGKLVFNWSDSFTNTESVIQAIKVSIPSTFYKDILTEIHVLGLPKEIVSYLIKHEIENGEEKIITVVYPHFSYISFEQANEFKTFSETFNKTIKVLVAPEFIDTVVDKILKITNCSLHVFDFTLSEFNENRLRRVIAVLIRKDLDIYEHDLTLHKKKRLFFKEAISNLYPFYVCFPEVFMEALNKNTTKRESCDLLLEHLEQYKSWFLNQEI